MSNNVVVQIPCLNEESTIGDVVRDFKQKLPKSRIIVYDNNSVDNSIFSQKNGKIVVVNKKGKEMLFVECLKII